MIFLPETDKVIMFVLNEDSAYKKILSFISWRLVVTWPRLSPVASDRVGELCDSVKGFTIKLPST